MASPAAMAPALRVEPFSGTAAEWDAFVRQQHGWTHFHLYGWRTVMRDALGHESVYLAARDAQGALCGVLPLVHVRSLLFGRYLMSMPFVNYGGPLGSSEAVAALAAAAVREGADSGAKLVELRSRHELPIDLAVSHRKITVVLDLPAKDAAPLWKGFDGNVRRRVKRSQKEGIVVKFGADQVRPFYEVFRRHMRDLGTPTHGPQLFDVIHREFPDAWFGCAWLGDKPIAGIVGFVWNGEFEVTWASALYEYKQLAANMHVYWAFMERCIAEGLSLFNFGRCTPGGGTHTFKLQWGSRDEQLWWYQAGAGVAAGTPSPDSGAYKWGPTVWQRLPLGVADALGPLIVRGIP